MKTPRNTNKNAIPKLFKDLVAAGFAASWQHPLYKAFPLSKKRFYITDIKVPKLAPFDKCYVDLYQVAETIHFSLVFIYVSKFIQCRSKLECRKIVEDNLPGWEEALESLFSNIIKDYKLNWAIEAAEPDTDNEKFEMVSYLEGSFSAGDPAKVKALLVEIREKLKAVQAKRKDKTMGKVMSQEDFHRKVFRLVDKWKSGFIHNLGDFPIENTYFEMQMEFIEEYINFMMLNGPHNVTLRRIRRFLDMQTSENNAGLMEIRFIGGWPEDVEVFVETLHDVDVADVHNITEFKTIVAPRTINNEKWTKKEVAEFLEELREDLEFD